MNSSNDSINEQTPTLYRVQNIFEITCTETPLNNNLVKKTIRASATKLTERRRSRSFDNRILIEETPTPLISRKKKSDLKYSVGKKKSKKVKTPVLRLPPSISGNSSGSKKIKKLLRKDSKPNDENFPTDNSPTATSQQTTPNKKASHIFKPKSKLTDDEIEIDNQGCDLSFESLKKRERKQNQLVVRLSEIFSNIEIDEDLNENNDNNNNKQEANLTEIDPSPIVLQRSNLGHLGYANNMESTKITSVILSPSKNTTSHSASSLTQVTSNENDDLNETSRFEYTILNENGQVHINEFNQLCILPTQYPSNVNSQKQTYNETESIQTKSLTNSTNKTKAILIDKTNKLNDKSKQKENETKSSRYSYCTDVSIDDVTIPISDDDSTVNSSNSSDYSTASSKENLHLNSKPTCSNSTTKITSTIKSTNSRILFGNTQSPVVLTNKTNSFIKQKTINETRSSMSTIETNTVQIEQIIQVNNNNNNSNENIPTKKSKKLLQLNCLLDNDDTLPGSSNPNDKLTTNKFSNIFKPKIPTTSSSNNQNKNKEKEQITQNEIEPSPIGDVSINNHNNSIVFNLTQQDLDFIFDSNDEQQLQQQQQRIISSRSSSKFSSTRNGSFIEHTTRVTTTNALATTNHKAVVSTTSKQLQTRHKSSKPKKNNQVLLSHFDLNSFVDSLNSTFSLTTENKYSIVFKISEEIADHVCHLNDKQFYDKTKILCLIKELISKDINFVPSVLNPRLQFVSKAPGVVARTRNDSTSNSETLDSDNDDSDTGQNELCHKCLQRNKLLTEVCIRCKLFYHKKCEKIRYIPVNGWICSACKTNNKK